ncbi:S-layer homology domain-containing protein [Ammoniphilus sp. CFH 90114]|uniref:S-layer homology domain-containing protein n=1 Tax=Ammoniphilus sp. CFH 90114 TaxID=2493665 RepID=UPI00100EBC43|nr:S-layer homology domain-containing protein [Ammoniphilus sp. CFH 90114]RXT03895.1 S-layer homology domain-containing protein [Ammoniphilus sp. CFH 90114]
MKKLLILSMLLLSMAAHSTQAAPQFKDSQGHWAEDTIHYYVGEGLVSGYPDGTFRPNQSISKAELIFLVAKFMNLKPSSTSPQVNHWLAKEGYLDQGMLLILETLWELPKNKNEVGPFLNQPSKRWEAAALFETFHPEGTMGQRNLKLNDKILQENLVKYKDLQMNHKESFFCLIALQDGMMKGFPDGYFRPYEPLNRAQAITVISFLDEKMVEERLCAASFFGLL